MASEKLVGMIEQSWETVMFEQVLESGLMERMWERLFSSEKSSVPSTHLAMMSEIPREVKKVATMENT
jgi:hypothetical protein